MNTDEGWTKGDACVIVECCDTYPEHPGQSAVYVGPGGPTGWHIVTLPDGSPCYAKIARPPVEPSVPEVGAVVEATPTATVETGTVVAVQDEWITLGSPLRDLAMTEYTFKIITPAPPRGYARGTDRTEPRYGDQVTNFYGEVLCWDPGRKSWRSLTAPMLTVTYPTPPLTLVAESVSIVPEAKP